MIKQTRKFTAVYARTGKWYSAWVEEVPGVNTQGKTLREAKENLKEALSLVLKTTRVLSTHRIARSNIRRESFSISV